MTSSKTFTEEMEGILDLASTLLRESDTEETRMYVQHKLKEIQMYLQEKQNQSEKALEERIEKEQQSIQELENRIAQISDGTVTENEALDYLQMFIALKDNEWDEAFNALLEIEKNPVDRILKILIDILKITFDECRQFQLDQNTDLAVEARYAGTNSTDQKDLKGLSPEQESELRGHVRYLQEKTSQYCVESISEKLLDTVKSNKTVTNYYRKQNERVAIAFDEYIKKCIQFSWLAHFVKPPVHLITEPKKECPKIIDQFVDHKLVPAGKVVDWPALVRGVSLKDLNCEVKVPWHLYDITRKRPKPRPRRMPTPPPEREPEARIEDVNTDKDDDWEPASRVTSVDDAGFTIHLPGSESAIEPIMEQNTRTQKESGQTPKRETLDNQNRQPETRSRSGSQKPQMTKGNTNRPTTKMSWTTDHQRNTTLRPRNRSTNKNNRGEQRTQESINF